jgi:Tol biopolymer transport system component
MRRLILIPLLSVIAAVVALVGASTPAYATYPGHNGLIAFQADTGSGSQIYTVRPNGHDLRQITHVDGEALQPDWAPDGRTIVFEFDRANPPPFCSVEIMNADGSGMVDLTGDRNGCEAQPSFTPDGQRIVFERFDDITFVDAIWSMDLTGGDRHQITTGVDNGVTDPNVAPDGNTLSFVAVDNLFGPPPNFEPAQGLFSSDLNGNDLSQLLPFTLDLAIKHDWAPDGKHILVGTNANFFDPNDSANIATIRPDGTDLHYLIHSHDPAVNAFAGSYSPDGKYIVFRLEDHGSFALMKMRSDGSHLQQILGFSSFRPRAIDWGPRTQAGD